MDIVQTEFAKAKLGFLDMRRYWEKCEVDGGCPPLLVKLRRWGVDHGSVSRAGLRLLPKQEAASGHANCVALRTAGSKNSDAVRVPVQYRGTGTVLLCGVSTGSVRALVYEYRYRPRKGQILDFPTFRDRNGTYTSQGHHDYLAEPVQSYNKPRGTSIDFWPTLPLL